MAEKVKVSSVKSTFNEKSSTLQISWKAISKPKEQLDSYVIELVYVNDDDFIRSPVTQTCDNEHTKVDISIEDNVQYAAFRVKPKESSKGKGAGWEGEWDKTGTPVKYSKKKWTSQWHLVDVIPGLFGKELEDADKKKDKIGVSFSTADCVFLETENIVKLKWSKFVELPKSTTKLVKPAGYTNFYCYNLQYSYSVIGSSYVSNNIQSVQLADVNQTSIEISVPSNADIMYFRIKPEVDPAAVWKKYKAKNKKSDKKASWFNPKLWTGKWSHQDGKDASTADPSKWFPIVVLGKDFKPQKPQTPSIEVDKFKLVATVDYYEDFNGGVVNQIEFAYTDGSVDNTGGLVEKYARANLVGNRASITVELTAGKKYRFRARALGVNTTLSGNTPIYSDWSEYTSNDIMSAPAAVPGKDTVSVDKDSSEKYYVVRVTYPAAEGAKSYETQYTDNIFLFATESGSGASSDTSDTTTTLITSININVGATWWFRTRAVNDTGVSSWNEPVSLIVGKKPGKPTIWSNVATTKIGTPLNLYWIHNSQDNSREVKAQIQMYYKAPNTSSWVTVFDREITKKITPGEEDPFSVLAYTPDKEGEYNWRVRTMGITGEYGDWSDSKYIDVWQPPTLSFRYSMTKNWEWDPFNFTVDSIYTSKGELGPAFSVLTKYPLYFRLEAGPKTQTPLSYNVSIISHDDYEQRRIDGEIIYIRDGDEVYNRTFDTSEYTVNNAILPNDVVFQNGVNYEVVATVAMSSGLTAEARASFDVNLEVVDLDPTIEFSYNADRYITYISPYVEDTSGELVPNVYLSVYRINLDGSFTLLKDNISNAHLVTVTDPHPTLGACKYRVVAFNLNTGNVSWSDYLEGSIFEPAIILQWDQSTYDFYSEEPDDDIRSVGDVMNSGPLLKLPFNVDITESNSTDVALIEYAGRENPVSYYGTHLGYSATWNTVIPKEDTETIFQLRRLARYRGDVYVREPSGMGYWAQVSVSFGIRHMELTVPITLSIRRVEGGA